MKRLIIYAASLLLATTSCSDFLNRPPMDAFSPDTFWADEDDLKDGINNLYTYMNHTWDEDNQSMDTYSGGANTVSSGTYIEVDNDNVWTNSYKGIYLTQEFLANYERAEVTEEVKNRYRGEALYFRALMHYNLMKRFGDVTIVTSLLNLDSPELYSARNNRLEVADFILSELLTASEFLPTQSWIEANDKDAVGRITKGAAMALRARVALYEGTRAKFHNYGEGKSTEYLTIAKESSKAVMDMSADYTLETEIATLFGPEGEDSNEVIMSYRYDEDQGSANPRQLKVAEGAGFVPTKALVDAFLCSDGLPITKSPLFGGYDEIDSEFANRDPRMAYTIWTPLTAHPNIPAAPYVPELTANKVGYMFLKGMDESLISSGKLSYTDEILFRLTEQYLIYAEACYELNGSITDAELDATINVLRSRGGMMVKLTNAFVSANGLDMREEIRRERRIELASEGFRYDDIIRWKTAETELPQQMLGAKYYSQYYAEGTVTAEFITPDGYIIAQTGDSRSFEANKHYLFPLPLEQLRLNPSLEQNPNWSF